MRSKKIKPLKIYWLHPHFYNWMGGHKYIFEVITRLQKTYGADVTLVTAGLTPAATARFQATHIPVIRLFGFSTHSPVYWLLLPVFLQLETWYLLYIQKIDRQAVFISSMFPANVLAHRLGRRAVQLCYEPFAFFHDPAFIAGFSRPQQLFIALIKYLYQNWDQQAVEQNRVTLTISKYNQQWIKDIHNVPSQVVYEGVDLSFFKPTASQKLTQKYRGQQMIFHATDYTPIKGTTFLIEALPLVIKKIPRLRLVISETLPHSPAKAAIVNRVAQLGLSSQVEFAGFLPWEELPAYLTRADVVVQPSIQQSMNLTVKEAMACGTPIITSWEGQEQTRDGEAGFLVDPHQTSTLAQRIVECLLDPALAKKMGRRGRQIIEQRFSWESVTAGIWNHLPPHAKP